jgi:hypothetical protein
MPSTLILSKELTKSAKQALEPMKSAERPQANGGSGLAGNKLI